MFQTEAIEERLLRKPSRMEFAVLLFLLGLNLYFTLTHSGNYYDFENYMNAALGDFKLFFYGYWLIPFLSPFAALPFQVSFMLWVILCLLGVWLAARVFNGNGVLALLSYQMAYSLFWGQISGIICGFLALFWWGMHRRQWWLSGLALLLAGAKPQSGAVFAFFLCLLADLPWKEKAKVLIIPILGIALTFAMVPDWVAAIFTRRSAVITWGNVSLWQWVGPWGLFLFLPALLVRMDREQRFLSFVSASILGFPYFLQTDLLTLLVFPVGLVPVLLSYLPGILLQFYSFAGQPSGVVVPLVVYAWQFWRVWRKPAALAKP